MNLSLSRWALCALATLLFASAYAPAAQAAYDEVPYPAPEVAKDGDSIWIGYNMCYLVVMGPPKACTGPHRIVEVPVGTDVCGYYDNLPGTCGNQLCASVPPAVPALCGHPTPSTNACDYYDNAPGTCGNPQPSRDPCDYARNVPILCKEYDFCEELFGNVPGLCGNPLPERDPCEYYDNAPGTCGNPTPDPCASVPQAVPAVCGHPTPSTDLCDHYDNAPGTCGNPQPSRDPCDYARNVPILCKEYDFCEELFGNVPGVCGNPLPERDPCEYYDNAPGTCGNPLPPTQPCQVYPNAPVLCRPYSVPVPGVDGELCVYVEENGTRDYLYCIPINR